MPTQPPKRRIGPWLAAAAIGALVVAEHLWPRRTATQREPQRKLRNLALGALDLAVVAGVQRPAALRLARRVETDRLGLAQALPHALPQWARDAAAMLLLDWTMYHWHVATHRVPLLWRLHRVHHVDRDMDVSTALRFHVVDMALSVPLRLLQVRLLGVGPQALLWWEGWFLASVLFHHADLDLPHDDRLAWLLTTPGMHDIHHRAAAAALNSNFSAGLSLWDRLHGTFSDVRPAAPIGIPGDGAQGLLAALAMPFVAAPIRPGETGSALPA